MTKPLLPNPYLLGVGITLLCYILIYGLKRLFSIKFNQAGDGHRRKWNDIVVQTVEHTTHLFMLGTSLYIAFQYIPHKKMLDFYVDRSYFILAMLQVMIWGNYLLEFWILSTINRKIRSNRAAAGSISLLKFLAKFLLFSVLFLFTLNNLDIKITTIVAGLGVGGIAVALAVQKILGDLLSSLSIIIDKPFVVGDFIILEHYLGEVEKIGLRTTHLRGLGGEQIIMPNSDLLSSRIRNMKRMHERRVAFLLSLTLELGPDQLEEAISIIKSILHEKKLTRFDRCHLQQVSRTSYDIETVYFVLTDDYNIFMDVQQDVLLQIIRSFDQQGLRFAYPTQTLHHHPTELFIRNPGPTENKPENKLQLS
jgi:small-conductance mechanosensitive channel